MGNKFCKYHDNVIIDENKQPLSCDVVDNKCFIMNYKKIIDDNLSPEEMKSIDPEKYNDKTNISCSFANNGNITSNFDSDKYKLATYTVCDKQIKDVQESYHYFLYAPADFTSPLPNRDDLIHAENGIEIPYDYYKDKEGIERHLIINHEAEKMIFEKAKVTEIQKELTEYAIAKYKEREKEKIDANLDEYIKKINPDEISS